MATIEIKDVSGASVENVELNAAVFGIEPNIAAMHEVVRAQRAAWRQGTHSTLTRGMVRGGGRKPWRQKGTGHARQGSTRSPQWTGGGTVFGPHPRDYSFSVNKKVVKLAMRSALAAKLADDQLQVVKAFGFEQPSTKAAAAFLKAAKLEGKRVTLVIADDDVETYLSFRNIKNINVLPVAESNTYEFVDNKVLIFTADALKRIQEVLA